MITLDSLLYRGYFPRELPPAFVTSSFASTVISNINSLPIDFAPGSALAARLPKHSVVRLGLTRRNMGIVNPIPFFHLSRELVGNWGSLQNHYQKSSISKSSPKDDPNLGRAIITGSNFDDLLLARLRLRSTSKYILKTDITKFYPSVYSHSIPWALHTKSIAKAQQRNRQLLGNQLDFRVRNCQDRQTVGIPIGPDTSLPISEIVLSAADSLLQSKYANLNGIRYVDDYEFGVQTYSEAEAILNILQQVLQTFELSINFAKTKILELPLPLDPPWIIQLREFNFRNTTKHQRTDLLEYFSVTFELTNQHKTDFVLKYAVARLKGLVVDKANWDIVQDFLFQCMMVESGTFLPVLEHFMSAQQKGYVIDKSRISFVMNYQIIQNSKSGKSSEVAWALWALIFWSVSLSKEAADTLASSEDSVVALLALDASHRGLIPTGLDTTFWETFMNAQFLYEEQWLLVYEANIKSWLPSQGGVDFVANDANFGFLKRNDVSFYDSNRLIAYKPSSGKGAGIQFTGFSLIDYDETEELEEQDEES